MASISRTRLLAKNYFLMGLNELLGAMRFYYPISILYFADITGSYAAAMSVFSFATITTTILEVPTGVLSDRWGRRSLLILGCVLEFSGALCYAFAAGEWGLSGPLWLYSGAFLFGVAAALFSGNNYALLYETAQSTRQTGRLAHILGRNSSMEQIGLAASGVIAATLLWLGASFSLLVFLSLLPMATNIVISILVTEPPKHSITEGDTWHHMKKAIALLISNKELRLLALCSSWKSGLGMSTHLFMPKFIESVWPLWAVPIYRTGQNFVGAASYWGAGKIMEKFGHYKTLFAGSLLSQILSIISFALSTALSPFILFFTQILWATGNTADQSLQQKYFSPTQRSTMGSIISLMGSLSNSILAILLGLAADEFGESNALILVAFAGIPVVFGYHRLYRNDKQKRA